MNQTLLGNALRIIGIFRLLFITYLFLFSLLTIIPFNWAEQHYYTLTAIEDGGKLCLLSLLFFILPGQTQLPFSKLTRWLPGIAFLLLLYPAIRSTIGFTQLVKSENPTSQHAFSWKQWILGHKAELDKNDFQINANDGQTLRAISFNKSGNHEIKHAILVLHGGSFSD